MGLEFAEYLAQTVRVQLVLIGRSAFPLPSEWDSWLQLHPATDDTSSKIRKLQDILKTGAKVAIFSADVSDEQEMQTVLDKVKVEFGPVHGIIHSAGISGGGIIALKTREAANAVLASKVQGTLVLERLFQLLPRRQAHFRRAAAGTGAQENVPLIAAYADLGDHRLKLFVLIRHGHSVLPERPARRGRCPATFSPPT